MACERFRITSEDTVSTLLKDLEQASVYKTTALALASKFKVNIDEHVIIKPHEPPTDPAPPPGDVRRPAARRPALALAASSRALENQSILEGASVLDADAGPGPPDLGPLAE